MFQIKWRCENTIYASIYQCLIKTSLLSTILQTVCVNGTKLLGYLDRVFFQDTINLLVDLIASNLYAVPFAFYKWLQHVASTTNYKSSQEPESNFSLGVIFWPLFSSRANFIVCLANIEKI